MASGGTAGDIACSMLARGPRRRFAATASVMLSTPPLTAIATRPMPSSTRCSSALPRSSSASPSPLSRRASASASCRRLRAPGLPARLRRRCGRACALAVRAPPGRVATLTATSPCGPATVRLARKSTARASIRQRRPNVVVSAKHASIAASSLSGRASSCTCEASRPFLPIAASWITSSTPSRPRSASSPSASSSGF